MIPSRTDYPDRSALAAGLAARVAGELAVAMEKQSRVTLAVPGGTTPGAFLEALSHHEIDWTRIDVLLTDERWVPAGSLRSNFALLKKSLLQRRAVYATALSFYREAAQPEMVIELLEREVRERLPVAVCVLGMGGDGHTASLFPDADRLQEALAEECPHAILPMRAGAAGEPRITLTAPVLLQAHRVHLLIQGEEKHDALARALQPGPTEVFPVRLILQRPGVKVHYAP